MTRIRAEHGASAVLVAILILPLVGITALAVDVGAMYAERAQLQNAADAGAMAAARYCAYHDDCADLAAQVGARNAAADVIPGNIIGEDPAIGSLTFTADTVTVPAATLGMKHPLAAALGIGESDVGAVGTAMWEASGQATVVPFAVGECSPDAFASDGVRKWYPVDFDKSCPGSQPGGFGWLEDGTTSCLKDVQLLEFTTITTGNTGKCVLTDAELTQATTQLGCVVSSLPKSFKTNIEKLFACFVGRTVLIPVYDVASDCGVAPFGKAYCITKFAAFEVLGLHVKVNGNEQIDHCEPGLSPKCVAPIGNNGNWGSLGFEGRFKHFVTPQDEWMLGPPRPVVRLIN